MSRPQIESFRKLAGSSEGRAWLLSKQATAQDYRDRTAARMEKMRADRVQTEELYAATMRSEEAQLAELDAVLADLAEVLGGRQM